MKVTKKVVCLVLICLVVTPISVISINNLTSASMTDIERLETLGVTVTGGHISNLGNDIPMIPPSIRVNPNVEFGITTLSELELLHNVVMEFMDAGFHVVSLSKTLTDKLEENGLLQEFDRLSFERTLERMTEEQREEMESLRSVPANLD